MFTNVITRTIQICRTKCFELNLCCLHICNWYFLSKNVHLMGPVSIISDNVTKSTLLFTVVASRKEFVWGTN